MYKFLSHDNLADAITGERIFPGEAIWDTTYSNGIDPFMLNGRSRVIKEDTIVWLAEQAGYNVVKCDAGDSGDATVVDGADVGVGEGEGPVGEVEVGRSEAPKRRATRKVKGE
jgi:hypothetical protein